jgi:hypothetical protein
MMEYNYIRVYQGLSAASLTIVRTVTGILARGGQLLVQLGDPSRRLRQLDLHRGDLRVLPGSPFRKTLTVRTVARFPALPAAEFTLPTPSEPDRRDA